MNQLKPIDYFSFSVGFLGTLLVLGAFGEIPKPLMVFSGIISALLCLLSMGPLSINLLFGYLAPIEQQLYAMHAFANLAPTLYFLAHLTETPWGKFIC